MLYLSYILLGLIPSFVWLLFYLRKDAHPEPKRIILKIFFLGMAAAIFAVIIETLAKNLLENIYPASDKLRTLIELIYISFGVGFIEEVSKYLAVEKKYIIAEKGVLAESEFDEPLDLMLYMVIAALGFAALENILKICIGDLPLVGAFLILSLRFLGATLLHALCSGVLGFFLALSFLNPKKNFYFFMLGLTVATLLHGAFNYSIIKIEESLMVVNDSLMIVNSSLFVLSLMTLIITLIGLAVFVAFGFEKLKKMASICKMEYEA